MFLAMYKHTMYKQQSHQLTCLNDALVRAWKINRFGLWGKSKALKDTKVMGLSLPCALF